MSNYTTVNILDMIDTIGEDSETPVKVKKCEKMLAFYLIMLYSVERDKGRNVI